MAKGEVFEIIENAKKRGSRFLLETEAKRVLQLWGVPTNRTEFAPNVETAVKCAKEIRYPVVLKIVSPDISSKGDVGGVRVGVGSEIELRQAFDSIYRSVRSAAPGARILGVSVQEHVFYEHEAVVRAWRHEKYGPVLMFGIKGIWMDLLHDVSFRLAPLDENEALEMISETRAYTILRGLGERHPCEPRTAAEVVKRAGDLLHGVGGIKEILIDPLFLSGGGKAVVADARVILE